MCVIWMEDGCIDAWDQAKNEQMNRDGQMDRQVVENEEMSAFVHGMWVEMDQQIDNGQAKVDRSVDGHMKYGWRIDGQMGEQRDGQLNSLNGQMN